VRQATAIGALALVIALAGCSTTDTHRTKPDGKGRSSTSPAPTMATTVRGASLVVCRPSEVRIGRVLRGGAGGTVYQNLPLTNVGKYPCEVPDAHAFFTDRAGKRVGAPAEPQTGLDHHAILDPGIPGHVIVGVDDPENIPASKCREHAAHRLHITLQALGRYRSPTGISICTIGYGRRPNLRLYGSGGTGNRENES
jgi:hypothetical protein